MSKDLFLLRGLPGAGKSTLAKSIGGLMFEADMYFLDADGNQKIMDSSFFFALFVYQIVKLKNITLYNYFLIML